MDLIAMLGIVGAGFGAVLALVGVLIARLFERIAKLEGRLSTADDYNRVLWMWARTHIDLYYRHRKPGAPDPKPIPERDQVT